MSRFFVRPDGPEGWAAGLAKPTHWRVGYSAHSLAYAWHTEDDSVPTCVSAAFRASGVAGFDAVRLIAGVPEYKVALPGGNTASQTDLFALLRGSGGETIAVAVEGKVDERFGSDTVAEWREAARDGKKNRLRHLLSVLDLDDDERLSSIRYQLLHRTASAVMEGERLGATCAVMLVHSFSASSKWFDDFAAFAALFDAEVRIGEVIAAGDHGGRPLFLGWVTDELPEVSAG